MSLGCMMYAAAAHTSDDSTCAGRNAAKAEASDVWAAAAYIPSRGTQEEIEVSSLVQHL